MASVQTLAPGPLSCAAPVLGFVHGPAPSRLGPRVAQGAGGKFKVRIKLPGAQPLSGASLSGAELVPGPAGVASAAKRKLQDILKGYPEPDASVECLAAVLSLHGDAEPFTAVFPEWQELLAVPTKARSCATAPKFKRHKPAQGLPAASKALLGHPPPPAPAPPSAPGSVAAAAGTCQQAVQAPGVQAAEPPRRKPDAGTPAPADVATSDRKPVGVSSLQVPTPVLNDSSSASGMASVAVQLRSKDQACGPNPAQQGPAEGGKKDLLTAAGQGSGAEEPGVQISHSDQATTFAITFHGTNPSPTEVTGIANASHLALGHRGEAAALLHPLTLSDSAPGPAGLPAAANLPPPQRQTSLRGRSVAVQTAAPCSLLPPQQVFSSGVQQQQQQPGTAAPLSLLQLTLTPQQCSLALPAPQWRQWGPECNREVRQLLAAATECKRKADSTWGKTTTPAPLPKLALYAEASLLWMRAVDIMMLPGSGEQATKAACLCDSTCTFLLAAGKSAETAILARPHLHFASVDPPRGAAVPLALAREALRALCDRLAARCVLCDCLLSAHKYRECADRLDRLAQQQQHGGGGVGPGGRARSSTSPGSSRQPLGLPQHHPQAPGHPGGGGGGGGGLPVAELGALQGKVAQVTRFVDVLRRATTGLQALLDKEEARRDERVAGALAHLAAIPLAGPGGDGAAALACAERALHCLRALW